jgi:MerR family mercuric resistance operon transcriptional regulator
MFIGELAKQAGLNIETVRFYEREGLLPSPPRSASGYRCYDRRHLETVAFIKRSQALGFSLREIRQLLDIHARLAAPGATPRPAPHDLKLVQIARERLEAIEEKMRALESMRNALTKFLRAYQRQKKLVCPAGR